MKKLLVALALLASLASAAAQNIPNHAVPIGRGPGVAGWGVAGPCAAGQGLVWSGATTDPACGLAGFPSAVRAGDVIYWNGSAWVTLAGNTSGTLYLQENSSGVPTWGAAGAATAQSQLFATPGAVSSVTITNSPIPTSAANIVFVMFDGVVQARNTVLSYNSGTGVLTFTNPIPANTQIVEVDWLTASVASGVISINGLSGVLGVSAGVTTSGSNIVADGTIVAKLAQANAFTLTNTFAGIVGVGTLGVGTNSPSTDVHLYQTGRANAVRCERNAVLAIGAIICDESAWGQNSATTSIKWTFARVGVNPCLVRLTSSSPCWGNENQPGGEEGDYEIWTVNGGTNYIENVKVDNNGLWILGTGNLFLPAGQGIVMPDPSNTMTYVLTYNHGLVDITNCNNVGSTCSSAGFATRFYSSAAGPGQPEMAIFYHEIDFYSASIFMSGIGTGSGGQPICTTAGHKLYVAIAGTC